MVRNNSDLEDNSSPESQQVIKSISDRRETSAFPKQEQKKQWTGPARKSVDEELLDVLSVKGPEVDRVVLKYTQPKAQTPVDQLQFVRKLRPIAMSAESEISPLQSFHDSSMTKKIEQMVEQQKNKQDRANYIFKEEPLTRDDTAYGSQFESGISGKKKDAILNKLKKKTTNKQ